MVELFIAATKLAATLLFAYLAIALVITAVLWIVLRITFGKQPDGSLWAGVEFKLEDAWVGLFWKRKGRYLDAWICLAPCLPVHVVKRPGQIKAKQSAAAKIRSGKGWLVDVTIHGAHWTSGPMPSKSFPLWSAKRIAADLRKSGLEVEVLRYTFNEKDGYRFHKAKEDQE